MHASYVLPSATLAGAGELDASLADAATLTGAGELDASFDDTAAAAAFFARTGVCVFNDVLPAELIDGCRAAFAKTSARVDLALAKR